MSISEFLNKLKTSPEAIQFNDVMEIISKNYHYSPTQFSNGVGDEKVINEAGANEGSCKLFAFAQLNNLTKKETLACFGAYYRDDVLQNPDGNDHSNIRNFIKHGWEGIEFSGKALTPKS